MERAICERCGERQPSDWAPGHVCVACGAAVRREARCAWCAEWVPAGRFCRACGCEAVPPELYGAARMLKNAGVDRFLLADRLRALDPEQAANLGRIYNAQLAVVMRRVDELRAVECGLLQRGFSRRLEEELVPRLPVDKEELAALAAGPAGPFHAAPERLAEIAERSPFEITRTLASIALVRLGHFRGAYAAVCQAVNSGDTELAREAATAFPHWRMRLSPYELWRTRSVYASLRMGIDAPRLAEVAGGVEPGSPLRPWAAAALVLAWRREYGCLSRKGEEPAEGPPEWVRGELEAGLASRDADLRFTCAMALGEDGIVARELSSADAGRAVVARCFLARNNSPLIASLLAEAAEETRTAILGGLNEPLPEALLEPVLNAVEHGGEESRARGVRLLLPSLTGEMVTRLARLGDPEILKALLGARRLPESRMVVRAVLDGGFFAGLSGTVRGAVEHVDFTDPAVLAFASSSEAATEAFVELAGMRGPDDAGVARYLAGVAFGNAPEETRSRAYAALSRHDWLTPAAIRELFGGPAGFLKSVKRRLSPELVYTLADRWSEVAELAAEEPVALAEFAEALGEKARQDPAAAGLLADVAVRCPGSGLPAVAALLRDSRAHWAWREVPERLLAACRTQGIEASLAAELAGALAATLEPSTLQSSDVAAIELLVRLIGEHPQLRKTVCAAVAAVLDQREWADCTLRPALDELADALGYAPVDPDAPVAEPPAAQEASILDHVVVFPDLPFQTLAEYAAFLKAMNAAANPTETMAGFGLTQDSFVECMTRWGEVIGASNEFALRYAELLAV